MVSSPTKNCFGAKLLQMRKINIIGQIDTDLWFVNLDNLSYVEIFTKHFFCYRNPWKRLDFFDIIDILENEVQQK